MSSVLPSAVVGGAPTIRIRGISSITLSNAPIWIVDGVRYLTNETSSAGSTGNSLLNNLSPEEIEDIEIVKGPSAATLYGTNAANGVVVVTTKKGRSGSTKWSITAENRTVSDRNNYQAQYANFGHKIGATAQIRCQIPVMETPSFTQAQGATCQKDSLTSYNFLEDPDNTFIHLGRGSLYGVQASGGSDAVRFFVSGDMNDEFGPIQMAQHDIDFYNNVRHESVSDQMLHPRQAHLMNFRTNLSASLSPRLDLSANAGWGRSVNYVEPDNVSIIGLLYTGQNSYGWKGCPAGLEKTGCGMTGADAKPWINSSNGWPYNDANSFAPGQIMQFVTPNTTTRFTGSLDANWRPLSWLQSAGTLGLDLANNDQFHVCMLNDCPDQNANALLGNVNNRKENRRNISAKVSAAGSWQYRPWVTFKTSVGSEYTNIENDFLTAQGRGLAPGASTLGATATFVSFNAQEPTAVKTLGYYVQEEAAIRDRLFLTVAARQDQNSAFGTKFQSIVYPKVSASWLISDEQFFPHQAWLNSFRLRTAYGANGVQPEATSALQTFRAATQSVPKPNSTTGTDLPGLTADQPGSPRLKPETSAELEAGFETDLFNRRVNLNYTFYKKNTTNALINVPIPSSVGSSVTSLLTNVGKTQNWGHELSITRRVDPAPEFRLGRHAQRWPQRQQVGGPREGSIDLHRGRCLPGSRHRCRHRRAAAQRPAALQRLVQPLHVRRRQQRRHHSGRGSACRRHAVQRRRRLREGHRVDPERLRSAQPQASHHRELRLQERRQCARRQLLPLLVIAQGLPRDQRPDGPARSAGARRRDDLRHEVSERHDLHDALRLLPVEPVLEVPRAVRIDPASVPRDPPDPLAGRLVVRRRRCGTSTRGRATPAWIRKRTTASAVRTAGNRTLPEVGNDFNSSPPPTYFTFRLNLKY